MKKLLYLFVIFFAAHIYPQISPSEFPKIGFADLYWLVKWRSADYSAQSYYYPELNNLGLTHVVSYADGNTLTPTLNNNIKILETGFSRGSGETFNNPYKYSLATGNLTFPYEAGGSAISLITTLGDNFGFGTEAGKSSWWIFPYNGECIGDKNKQDLPTYPGTWVHFAQVGVHSQGILLKAKPDVLHLPYDNRGGHQFNYKLVIRARIDGSGGSTNVAKVRIWEQMPSPPLSAPLNHLNIYDIPLQQTENYQTLTDYEYYLTANDFAGTDYVDLISPATFRKTVGITTGSGPSDLFITIEWLGTRNLYVDKIAVYNTFYEDLFIANSTIQTTTRNNIKSNLDSLYGSVKTHQSFAHLYNDEPAPIMFRAVGEVSNLSEQQLGTGKYVNGAVGAFSNDMLLHANSERRVPYALYDIYTISHGTDSASNGTNSIQNSYNTLINNNIGSPGHGVTRFNGFKQAIEWAQNFTPDNISDDVPFYSTIQVCAEKELSNGNITEYYRRAPTAYEILAEGNLSLCYGAKGIMYYTIMTDAPSNGYAVYGLFDQDGNEYNDRVDPIEGLVQNPNSTQIPNSRYDAVKKLNQFIDNVSSELLQLTWRNGFSIHEGQPIGTFISNVSSGDAAGSTFVELSTFKKTSEFTNNNLEYFFVVNRRTLSTESRDITVTFNKTSSYNIWKVTEVGTDNLWIVSKTGSFQAAYEPGEGKLFKFEPMFVNSTETFSSADVTVTSSFTVPSGKTLNVNSGSNFYFNNNITLTVNGTLNATNAIFDRVLGTWGSIIFDGSSSANSLLDDIEVRYASDIQCIDGANVTIQNSLIEYCTNGIYVYNSQPEIINNIINEPLQNGIYGEASMQFPILLNNTITKTNINQMYREYQGIWFVNSPEMYAAQNDVSGFFWGAYFGGGTMALLTDYSITQYNPNNRFTDNSLGIAAAWGSYVLTYPNNSIYNNNSYDAYATNSGELYAQYNYWGGGSANKYVDGTSTIDAANYLVDDPWDGYVLVQRKMEFLVS